MDWKFVQQKVQDRAEKLEGLIAELRDRANAEWAAGAHEKAVHLRDRAELYRVEQRVFEQLETWLRDAAKPELERSKNV